MSKAHELCEWSIEEEDCSTWQTACQKVFEFTDEGPKENGFEYCPFCGGDVFIVTTTEDNHE